MKKFFVDQIKFIFSWQGSVGRSKYVGYAFLLEIFFRICSGLSNAFQDIPLLILTNFMVLVVIILKWFNYKKRFCGITNKPVLSGFLATFYIIIGAYLLIYAYLSKLATYQAIYELTQNEVFSKYANINIPDSILNFSAFILVTVMGIIMFFCLLCCPNRNEKINAENNKMLST